MKAGVLETKTAPGGEEFAHKIETIWQAMHFLEEQGLKIRERHSLSLDFFMADTLPALEEMNRYCYGENINKEGLKTRTDAVMGSIKDFIFLVRRITDHE